MNAFSSNIYVIYFFKLIFLTDRNINLNRTCFLVTDGNIHQFTYLGSLYYRNYFEVLRFKTDKCNINI